MSMFGQNIAVQVARAIYGDRPEPWSDLDWEAQKPFVSQAQAALSAMHSYRHLLDREHIITVPRHAITALTRFLERPNGAHRPVPDLVFEAGGAGVLVRTFPWTAHRDYEATHRARGAAAAEQPES